MPCEEAECRIKLVYERKTTSTLHVMCKPFNAYVRHKRELETCVPFFDKDDVTRNQCVS